MWIVRSSSMKSEQIMAVRCKCGRPAHVWGSRDGYLCGCINPDCTISLERSRKSKAESIEKWNAKMKRESHGNAWHPCQYVDCKLEHDGSWIDGKWYEWEDVHGNREVARMKLAAIDHFYPHAKIIKEEGVCRYRELEEGEDNADH